MAQLSKTGDRTGKANARKPGKNRPSVAPATKPRTRPPASDPIDELKEARAQQEATADILKVIASSPSDTTPVFEAIASSAKRLLGGFSTAVLRFLDGTVHLAALTPTNAV